MNTVVFSTSSIFVITTVTLLIMFFAWKDFSTYQSVSHKDFKSVIVSIGVLGTFVGIVIGLWFFDTSNIRNSVPELLKGLKIAFITSIEGMLVSVILSIVQVYQRKTDSSKNEIDLLRDVNLNIISLIEHIEFNNLELSYNKGNYYFNQNEYDKAIKAYKKVLLLNPSHEEAIYKLSDLFLRQEKFDEAEELYKKAFKIYPNNPKIKNYFNKILLEKDRAEKDRIENELLEEKKRLERKERKIQSIDNLKWLYLDKNKIEKLSWLEANEKIKGLNTKGNTGWRLPIKEELHLLYADKVKSKNIKKGTYWTSENGDYNNNINFAWSTHLGSKFSLLSFDGWSHVSNKHYVLYTRG